MTLDTIAEPILVLATGAIPNSKGLDAGFAVHNPPAGPFDIPSELAVSIKAIAAAGPRRITDELMAELPSLEIIASFGAGFDRVDVEAASRRGVVVTNTPDVLTDEVADFTIGLTIATVRRIAAADAFVRRGDWAAGKVFPFSPSLRNRRIGVVGMGRIGEAVARRCAGMGLEVAYHSRTSKPALPYAYYPTSMALAEAVDLLIVVVPGGPATDGMIDASVIDALGPNGILINVARGSVVHEAALIDALKQGRLLAAGLDVFLDEPGINPQLLELPNVLLSPHIGSASVVTREAMGNLLFANIASWFSGAGALTPVNGQARNTG